MSNLSDFLVAGPAGANGVDGVDGVVTGSNPEVYNLTLSTSQTDVTGNGQLFKIPFDVEDTSRSWASNVAGVVTLQPGTYIINGIVRFDGNGTADRGHLLTVINGVTEYYALGLFTDQSLVGSVSSYVITLNSPGTVELKATITGDTLTTYDCFAGDEFTKLNITKLPVQSNTGVPAEIYRLTLSTQQNNVTGDGTVVDVPFDTEAEARSWASNVAGVVTLQPGTYHLIASTLLIGSNGTNAGIKINVGGVPDNSHWDYNITSAFRSVKVSKVLTISTPTTVKISTAASGGSLTTDISTDSTQTYLEIVRIPIQSSGKTLIAEISNSVAGDFDFNNIPQTYNKLIIEGMVRGNTATTITGVGAFLNEDLTTTNYHFQRVGGDNGATSNNTEGNTMSGNSAPNGSSPANSYGFIKFEIPEYTGPWLKLLAVNSKSYQDVDSARVEDALVTSSITAPITRIRVRNPGYPTIELLGTLRLYGEM